MYVIYNNKQGLLCDDEDALGGWDYSYELDEFTVRFSDLDSAKRNCLLGEIILKEL